MFVIDYIAWLHRSPRSRRFSCDIPDDGPRRFQSVQTLLGPVLWRLSNFLLNRFSPVSASQIAIRSAGDPRFSDCNPCIRASIDALAARIRLGNFSSSVSSAAAAYSSSQPSGLSPDLILGHVMAHEIGHTLLGPNAHDLYGIMQASLPLTDIGRMLYFTSVQSRRLRTELLARKRAT